jgi:hypothetical protein
MMGVMQQRIGERGRKTREEIGVRGEKATRAILHIRQGAETVQLWLKNPVAMVEGHFATRQGHRSEAGQHS